MTLGCSGLQRLVDCAPVPLYSAPRKLESEVVARAVARAASAPSEQ